MPYIKKEQRWELAQLGRPQDPGELNYLLTKLCGCYLEDKRLSYSTVNDVLGALEGAKQEFYRRVAVPYEDEKIRENGDVYPAELTGRGYEGPTVTAVVFDEAAFSPFSHKFKVGDVVDVGGDENLYSDQCLAGSGHMVVLGYDTNDEVVRVRQATGVVSTWLEGHLRLVPPEFQGPAPQPEPKFKVGQRVPVPAPRLGAPAWCGHIEKIEAGEARVCCTTLGKWPPVDQGYFPPGFWMRQPWEMVGWVNLSDLEAR